MYRKLGLVVLAVMLAFLPASAMAITMNLDIWIKNSTTLIPAGPYGTITLEDNSFNSNILDITISLNDNQNRINAFMLNYDDTTFPVADTFFSLASLNRKNNTFVNTSVSVVEDSVSAGSYKLYFDLGANPTGQTQVNPYYGQLSLKYLNGNFYDLNPEHFVFQAYDPETGEDTGLYAAVHIGDYPTVGQSIWVGADSPDQTSNVPEPTSIFVAGSGLLWLVGLLRRKNLLNL